MRKILFDERLEFEINLIGYKSKGESIVFFIKTDGKVCYTGVVDCYEYLGHNETIDILNRESVTKVDFVCWTHPHEDHTLGLEKIFDDFCNETTQFCIPRFKEKEILKYKGTEQRLLTKLIDELKSRKKKKVDIEVVENNQILDKIELRGLYERYPYEFKICSFAPCGASIFVRDINDYFNADNMYSVGLNINIGHFWVMLTGDIENPTIAKIRDIWIENPIDYLKIPHHASASSNRLISKLQGMGIAAPEIATSTVYRAHKLPNVNILKMYKDWENNTKVYVTGSLEEASGGKNFGVVKTTIDVLEKEKMSIKTFLIGSAVVI